MVMNPPVPNSATPDLIVYTLDHWLTAGDGVDDMVAESNLANLNQALAWSGANGMPIYGRGGTDTAAEIVYKLKPSTANPSIKLAPDADITCAPGCKFVWVPASGASPAAMVVGPSDRARWRGGLLVGGAGSTYETYTAGDIFDVSGVDVILRNVTVRGFNGFAFTVRGDRVQVINPTVIANNFAPAVGGVRVVAGYGCRVTDGVLTVTGDAVLISPEGTAGLSDCAVDGARLAAFSGGASATGRLFVVTTAFGNVTNVRFNGGSCFGKSGQGSAVHIGNTSASGRVADISMRDLFIDWAASTAPAITVDNGTTRDRAVAGIAFDNVLVANPKRTALLVTSSGAGAGGTVAALWWLGGGVVRDAASSGALDSTVILKRLDGALFSALTIAAGSAKPVVTVAGASTGACSDVAFSDVGITGAQGVAVAFEKATNCAYGRGAISSDPSVAVADAAVTLSAQSVACSVEGVDLEKFVTSAAQKISSSAANYRLWGNHGSAQVTPLGLGAIVAVALSGTQITVNSSYVKVTGLSGSPPTGTLQTINGGKAGDVLVLTVDAGSLTVSDGGGNLKLEGSCTLGSVRDTLTLLRRTSDWVEIARSHNG